MSNYKIHPEQEYLLLEEYYKTGDGSNMPPELQRNESIYRFVRPFLDKGYLSQQQIVNLVYSHFTKLDQESASDAMKYRLTLKTTWNHVTNARKFYFEDKEEKPSVHRQRLTKLLYKQLEILKVAMPDNPVKVGKIVAEVINKIADLNKVKEPDTPENEIAAGDTMFILSDNAKEFPEIEEVTDKELYLLIDDFTKNQELTPAQRERIIKKDIQGEII